MAGMAGKIGQVGVLGFAAVGFSQTVWFGVKAMQNHDPGGETRTRAASTRHAPKISARSQALCAGPHNRRCTRSAHTQRSEETHITAIRCLTLAGPEPLHDLLWSGFWLY